MGAQRGVYGCNLLPVLPHSGPIQPRERRRTGLARLLGDGRLTDFLVRKSAHFLEYTGLCLLLSFACAATWGRRYTAVSLPIASLYAITDEVHQRFVPGRSCQAADWAIDTAGAALGLLCAGVLLWLWLRYRTKKHDKN